MVTIDLSNAEKQIDGDANMTNDDLLAKDAEITPDQPIDRGAICDLDIKNVIGRRLRDRNNSVGARRLSYLASVEHVAMLAISEEPRSYEQATESDDHKQWEQAMDEEYDSLIKNRTWNLVNPPRGQKVIDNRWVYKLKQNGWKHCSLQGTIGSVGI